MAEHPSQNLASREWALIEKILLESNKEQKRARRWSIFFRVLIFVYIFAGLLLFRASGQISGAVKSSSDHVALVPINGVISADDDANANDVAASLRAAFKAEHSKAILLVINSPGGSPVQSGYINDEIYRLKKLYPDKKVYAAIADIGASGAYYIAVAADEIYADKASLVGSIGVTASGFGFVDLMEKIGVERRTYTSGEHKGFLDPFAPEQPQEVKFWESVLESTHKQFISVVEAGRGDKLDSSQSLYNGLIWNGEQALDLGLIDGLGSAGFVARDVIGIEEIVSYGKKNNPLEKLIDQLGVSIGRGVANSLQAEGTIELK